jgi:hypothetical protein
MSSGVSPALGIIARQQSGRWESNTKRLLFSGRNDKKAFIKLAPNQPPSGLNSDSTVWCVILPSEFLLVGRWTRSAYAQGRLLRVER